MKINNSLDVARWEKTKCTCDHSDIEKCHPIHNCTHCKCQQAWDSVPKNDFAVKKNDIDSKGNVLETTHDEVVSEITLVRGTKYEEVVGWNF